MVKLRSTLSAENFHSGGPFIPPYLLPLPWHTHGLITFDSTSVVASMVTRAKLKQHPNGLDGYIYGDAETNAPSLVFFSKKKCYSYSPD